MLPSLWPAERLCDTRALRERCTSGRRALVSLLGDGVSAREALSLDRLSGGRLITAPDQDTRR